MTGARESGGTATATTAAAAASPAADASYVGAAAGKTCGVPMAGGDGGGEASMFAPFLMRPNRKGLFLVGVLEEEGGGDERIRPAPSSDEVTAAAEGDEGGN